MDVQLYNNLMFLKTYEGDAEELCLTFTVANDDFGNNKEVPLIPNGADVVVTNANKHRYIGTSSPEIFVDTSRNSSYSPFIVLILLYHSHCRIGCKASCVRSSPRTI